MIFLSKSSNTSKSNTFKPGTFISIRLFLLSTISIALLYGCGSEPKTTQVEKGDQQQILYLNSGAEPQDLDPHTVTGIPEVRYINALYEGLTVKNGKTLEAEPAAAESWTISADGRVYQFKIRDNAVWSNGDPVRAQDFVFSWMRQLSPQLGSEYANSLYSIKNAEAYNLQKIDDFGQVGVKALDDKTLQVTLHSPTPYFLQLLDHHSTYPVHPATIEKFDAMHRRGTQWTRVDNIVTNGAFLLKEWKTNKYILVERNPNYWGKDRILLNAIHFYPVDSLAVEERMFRAGQLHVTYEVLNEKIPVYQKNNPEVLHLAPYMGTYYYELNVTRPPLDNQLVRQALAMSIYREQLVPAVVKAGEKPSLNFVPPDVAGYANVPSPLGYNPQKAKELLAKAGYPNGEGFPKLTILYNSSETHRLMAAAVQSMWKQNLNIDVELTNQEWKVYINSRNDADYDIARAAWIGDYADPNTFADMMLTHNGNNRSRWSNADYDRLIAEANAIDDQQQRYAKIQQAQTILLDEAPIIPIYTYSSKHLVQTSVRNWPTNVLNYFNHYRDIYLEPVTTAK